MTFDIEESDDSLDTGKATFSPPRLPAEYAVAEAHSQRDHRPWTKSRVLSCRQRIVHCHYSQSEAAGDSGGKKEEKRKKRKATGALEYPSLQRQHSSHWRLVTALPTAEKH